MRARKIDLEEVGIFKISITLFCDVDEFLHVLNTDVGVVGIDLVKKALEIAVAAADI